MYAFIMVILEAQIERKGIHRSIGDVAAGWFITPKLDTTHRMVLRHFKIGHRALEFRLGRF
ncbi:hypothetical protein D3C84_1238450 [compost metagenome]